MPVELWTLQKWNALVEQANRLYNCALLVGTDPVDLGREILGPSDMDTVGANIGSFHDPSFFQGGFQTSGSAIPLGVAPILWLKRDQDENLTSVEQFEGSAEDFSTTDIGVKLPFSPIELGTVQKIDELKNWYQAGHFCGLKITQFANDLAITLSTAAAQQAYLNFFNTVLIDPDEVIHDFVSYAFITRVINTGQLWVAYRQSVGNWSDGQISIHNPNASAIQSLDIHICFSTIAANNWPLGVVTLGDLS